MIKKVLTRFKRDIQISAQKRIIDAFQVLNVNQKAALMKHLYVFLIILITVLLLLLEACLGRFQVKQNKEQML